MGGVVVMRMSGGALVRGGGSGSGSERGSDEW